MSDHHDFAVAILTTALTLCLHSAAPAAPNDLFGPPYPLPAQSEADCSQSQEALPSPELIYPSGPVLTPPATPTPVPVWEATPSPIPPGATNTPIGPLEDFAPGGSVSPQFGLPTGPDPGPGIPNPITVPVADDLYAWDQITDVVSDYFPIAAEQPAVRGPEMWSEGRIETAPQSGATLLEPHRGDSVGWFNLWESTFQTIRRRAVVRVIPQPSAYVVEVVVEKELEDLPHPEHSTAGAASFRNDGSLPTYRTGVVSRTRTSPRWVPLGRDAALEQRILADIHARLTGATTEGSVFPPVGR